jgi:hypothetical protein
MLLKIIPIFLLGASFLYPVKEDSVPTKDADSEVSDSKIAEKNHLSIYRDASTYTFATPDQNVSHGEIILKGLVKNLYPDSLLIDLSGGGLLEFQIIENDKFQDLHIKKSGASPASAVICYTFPGLVWEPNYIVNIASKYDLASFQANFNLSNSTDNAFNVESVVFIDGASLLPPKENQKSDAEGKVFIDQRGTDAIREYQHPISLSIQPKSSKQIQWVSLKDIPVTKEYRVNLPVEALGDVDGHPVFPHVETWVFMRNGNEKQLSKNIPAGPLTVYYTTPTGGKEVIARTMLPKISQGEAIEFRVPDMERKQSKSETAGVSTRLEQTEFRKLAETVTEAGYRCTLKNNEDNNVSIKVVLDMPVKEWNITRESLMHKQEGRNRVYWILEIPAHGEMDLKYRINLSREENEQKS